MTRHCAAAVDQPMARSAQEPTVRRPLVRQRVSSCIGTRLRGLPTDSFARGHRINVKRSDADRGPIARRVGDEQKGAAVELLSPTHAESKTVFVENELLQRSIRRRSGDRGQGRGRVCTVRLIRRLKRDHGANESEHRDNRDQHSGDDDAPLDLSRGRWWGRLVWWRAVGWWRRRLLRKTHDRRGYGTRSTGVIPLVFIPSRDFHP